jgi:acetyl/propionyl-CoA carboxylase alpha subunit
MFKRVLVANRGEIARRIMKTLKVLGIEAVAVHSEADRLAPFVQEADLAVELGPAEAAASYLDGAKILAAARATRAEAIHPGYGFLSENAGFAAACENEGIKFIGPGSAAMEKLGNKKAAREVAEAAGIPVVPGGEVGADNRAAREVAKKVGFPVLVKSAGGGGGKGMRRVTHLDDLDEALGAARRESMSAFGTDALILERYVEGARHVEVQILGDAAGQVLPIMERDCTLQRRHQKVIEECPSPKVDAALRKRLLEGAAKLAGAAGYENAGTLEFLLTPEGETYFLEMNARLQVEHPVTELVCGLDLVAWQIWIASGVRFAQKKPDMQMRGHAIEARVYAEDPATGFLPQSGTLSRVRWPEGPGIRVDAGVVTGSVVTPHYDPMLGKVIAWGSDREQARARLVEALRGTLLVGLTTNVPFLVETLHSGRFRNSTYDTTSLDRGDFELNPVKDPVPDEVLMLARAAMREKPKAKAEPRTAPSTTPAPAPERGPWDASDSFRIVGGPAHG